MSSDSLNKYFEILKTIDTEDWSIVNQLETEYIQKNKSLSPNGYNIRAGGDSMATFSKDSLTHLSGS